MKFYDITPEGIDWAKKYSNLSTEESNNLPREVHTDFWVLTRLEDSSEALSASEIKSGLKVTEGIHYPMGAINASLSRLGKKGFSFEEDWG